MVNVYYQCSRCRRVFEESEAEVSVQKEYRGECHGAPAYESVEHICCPFCGAERSEEVEIEEIVSLYNEQTDIGERYEYKYKELRKQLERKAVNA